MNLDWLQNNHLKVAADLHLLSWSCAIQVAIGLAVVAGRQQMENDHLSYFVFLFIVVFAGELGVVTKLQSSSTRLLCGIERKGQLFCFRFVEFGIYNLFMHYFVTLGQCCVQIVFSPVYTAQHSTLIPRHKPLLQNIWFQHSAFLV